MNKESTDNELNHVAPPKSDMSDPNSRINSFWSAFKNTESKDPVSVFESASRALGGAIIARLPRDESVFFSHEYCSAEGSRVISAFLDEYYTYNAYMLDEVTNHTDALPEDVRKYSKGGLISCPINQDGITTGYMACICSGPPTPTDSMLLLNIRGMISINLPSDPVQRYNNGLSNTVLFRALIEGKTNYTDLSYVESFIKALPDDSVWHMLIMIISSGEENSSRMRIYLSNINNMITSSLIMIYKGKIVVLGHVREKYPLSEQHVFTEYLRSNGLTCGVSRSFDSIHDFSKYYDQAKTALSIGSRVHHDQVLHSYEECAPFHVIQLAAQSVGIDELQSTHIFDLNHYDREKGTDLLKTLREYVSNIKDIGAVADKLHVHRNTLFHRLRKIEEITGWDLNNGDDIKDIFFFLRVLDITDTLKE